MFLCQKIIKFLTDPYFYQKEMDVGWFTKAQVRDKISKDKISKDRMSKTELSGFYVHKSFFYDS